MKHIAFALLALPALAMAEDAPVSFKTDIQPLLNTQCVFCHVDGAENAGLNLGRRKSHESLLAPSTQSPLKRVEPGEPDRSYLVHKLRGTQIDVGGSGNAMPMYDPPRAFDAATLALIERWIRAGAPNN